VKRVKAPSGLEPLLPSKRPFTGTSQATGCEGGHRSDRLLANVGRQSLDPRRDVRAGDAASGAVPAAWRLPIRETLTGASLTQLELAAAIEAYEHAARCRPAALFRDQPSKEPTELVLGERALERQKLEPRELVTLARPRFGERTT